MRKNEIYESKRKEIVKIRPEINEIENKKMGKNQFEKINKIDKPLAKLMRKENREDTN